MSARVIHALRGAGINDGEKPRLEGFFKDVASTNMRTMTECTTLARLPSLPLCRHFQFTRPISATAVTITEVRLHGRSFCIDGRGSGHDFVPGVLNKRRGDSRPQRSGSASQAARGRSCNGPRTRPLHVIGTWASSHRRPCRHLLSECMDQRSNVVFLSVIRKCASLHIFPAILSISDKPANAFFTEQSLLSLPKKRPKLDREATS